MHLSLSSIYKGTSFCVMIGYVESPRITWPVNFRDNLYSTPTSETGFMLYLTRLVWIDCILSEACSDRLRKESFSTHLHIMHSLGNSGDVNKARLKTTTGYYVHTETVCHKSLDRLIKNYE
jgi:hypothetical protein